MKFQMILHVKSFIFQIVELMYFHTLNQLVSDVEKEPKGTKRHQKEPKGTKRTQKDPKGPKGTKRNQKEPKGTKRNQKEPLLSNVLSNANSKQC